MKICKLLAIPALAVCVLIVGSDQARVSSQTHVVDEMFVLAVGGCTSPNADNGAFGLIGTKLPNGGLTFRTNPNTFPAGLKTLDVQNAINSSFATWDSATSSNLFTDGGVTTARPGAADGISTIGFGHIKGKAVAVTFGWFSRKTGLLSEFDTVLSSGYNWATNPLAVGDCGGAIGTFDVQDIATHEVGHVVGLTDLTQTSSNAQTMYGYVAYQELSKRTPASGDLRGVTVLYGP